MEWPSYRMLKHLTEESDIMIRLETISCTLTVKATHIDHQNKTNQHILIFSMYFIPHNESEISQIQNLFLSVAKSVQISGHTITFLKTDDHICSYESSTNEFMIVAKSKNHNHKQTWVHDQTVHFPFYHPEKCILRINSPTYSVLSNSNSTNSMDEDF